MNLIVITGLSGAGKGVALHMFEDLGYEAIDNLPLAFLPAIVQSAEGTAQLAVAVDVRSRDFSVARFAQTLEKLKQNPAIVLKLIFLDCDDEVLRRRFTETRRRHPLAGDRPVLDGIRQERALTQGLREAADMVIDTSDLKAAELGAYLTAQFGEGSRSLSLSVLSFAYRHGVPREADLVFDVRFLKNPHYVPELKRLTGQNDAVGSYIETDPDFSPFFSRLRGLLLPLLPRYLDEGKQYLTLAIGCTGGQHRSVYTAEKLATILREAGYAVTLRHRELKA